MEFAIDVQQLVKRYPNGTRSVDDLSFHVATGEIFGFLGPNGAGKSTTVRMLTTLSLPSAGTALVGGYDVVNQPAAVRRVAGVALQEVGVDPLMTARELLLLQGRIFGLGAGEAGRRASELLQIVELETVADKAAGSFSGGMRRRLDLALALVHEPAILFLDEPTTGLDPASRRALWAEVERLNRERGMTIFLTTQYLEEADALAHRVAIINHGRIVAAGAPEALKRALGGDTIALTFADPDAAARAELRLTPLAQRVQRNGTALWLYLDDAARAVPTVVSALGELDLAPERLTLARPTLDDVFLKATGRQLSAGAAVQ